ncbi:hypothetical protein [Streptomyces sp. NPDC048155]|uniref:hypothetical protein n=1 Tax=Streptomyces sp. NPDC048155 TaxID=3154818 RepID=UPI0033F5E299
MDSGTGSGGDASDGIRQERVDTGCASCGSASDAGIRSGGAVAGPLGLSPAPPHVHLRAGSMTDQESKRS